jgi:hypothetical protein
MTDHESTNESVRVALDHLRSTIRVLAQQWRLKRAGIELRRRFGAIEIAMPDEPRARVAADELVMFLDERMPSRIVEPALLAAEGLVACWGGGRGGFYSITSDGHQTQAVSMTPAEMAEMLELQQTMPADGSSGDDCAICRLLERQRIARLSKASA